MFKMRVLALAGLLLAMTGCGDGTQTEAITELLKEIQQLKVEMASVRDAIEDIHRTTVIDAGNQDPQIAGANISFPLKAGDKVLGSDNATIAIVEYTDYQCPFCQRFDAQTFKRLREKYVDSGKVRYVSRDFPLGFHAEAKDAAVAAHCAGEQNAYWEMREGLFSNSRKLGSGLYEKLATELRLDKASFQQCLQLGEVGRDVERDMADALALGVTGTPSFFVGRIKDNRLVEAQRVVGAQSFSFFDTLLSGLLKTDS